MHLALLTTFAASRKEPLAEVLDRVHAAMIAAEIGEPYVQFVFSDSPVAGGVSSVDRVLKRFPQLQPFAESRATHPGGPETKMITNRVIPDATDTTVDFSTLLEIARGVPRSFPFHNVALHLTVPAFSGGVELPSGAAALIPGVDIRDSWWVNGRDRSVTALTIVEADPAAKKLPPPPDAVIPIFAACGKVKKTVQAPLVIAPAPRPSLGAAAPDAGAVIRTIVHDYRTRISEIAERAGLPHDLPPNREAIERTPPGTTSGAKKPALVHAFAPMGYDCRGESGTFTLRRRTQSNLTVELHLDVGTRSNLVLAIFRVQGLIGAIGFKATLILPVTRRAVAGAQYPIGGPDQWQQIVENLAALVMELDRSFVPAIEAASGPAPAWYRPESSSAAHG